jgi:hypothetical protein
MYTPSLNYRLQQILVNTFAEYEVLLEAIKNGDLNLIKKLFANNYIIVEKITKLDNYSNYFLFSAAAMKINPETFKLLIAKINSINIY